MKPRLVNGVAGDPAVYGFLPKSGEAIVFDLGDISSLGVKELLKIRAALVSHTHIDHFIGFDTLLRANIPHFRMVDICGPDGIVQNVVGKIKGYTWNLLDDDQVGFRVIEISKTGEVAEYSIKNNNGFAPIRTGLHSFDPTKLLPVATLSDGTSIGAVCLDHGIPSIAYLVEAAPTFPVDVARFRASSLPPGDWIRSLQANVKNGNQDAIIEVNGIFFRTDQLATQILGAPIMESVGYITDIAFSAEACQTLHQCFRRPSILICECSYSSDDRVRAFRKKHLTARQTALLAASAGAEALWCFHVSGIYAGREGEIIDEAQSLFRHFNDLPWDDLQREVESEVGVISAQIKKI